MTEPTSYTKVPRATMWLLQEDDFVMGGDSPDSKPAFQAFVDSFYISKAPITNEQYEAFQPDFARAENSSHNDPAVGVSLLDATGYCEWYSRISKKNFRLPTEIEWEFACRGGSTGRYFVSEGKAPDFIWTAENSENQLHESDSLRFNPAGLHNMLGNIWEWTSSRFVSYPLEVPPLIEAIEAESQYVLRGGSFRNTLAEMGSGERRAAGVYFKSDDVGFRIVRSL